MLRIAVLTVYLSTSQVKGVDVKYVYEKPLAQGQIIAGLERCIEVGINLLASMERDGYGRYLSASCKILDAQAEYANQVFGLSRGWKRAEEVFGADKKQ